MYVLIYVLFLPQHLFKYMIFEFYIKWRYWVLYRSSEDKMPAMHRVVENISYAHHHIYNISSSTHARIHPSQKHNTESLRRC
jgi:hypothetical protein